MSPSQADRDLAAPLAASELFVALERAYDGALQASMCGDLETCAELLAGCDLLLARSDAVVTDDSAQVAQQAALAAHARLLAILQGQRDECMQDLARVQLGKKALHGYAGERQLGSRVESRA